MALSGGADGILHICLPEPASLGGGGCGTVIPDFQLPWGCSTYACPICPICCEGWGQCICVSLCVCTCPQFLCRGNSAECPPFFSWYLLMFVSHGLSPAGPHQLCRHSEHSELLNLPRLLPLPPDSWPLIFTRVTGYPLSELFSHCRPDPSSDSAPATITVI